MFGGRFSSSTGLIGIDYGSRSIKMLQMREKSGRASVVGAARIDIDLQHLPTSVDANDIAAHDAAAALQHRDDASPHTALGQQIRAAFAAGGFTGSRCVISMPREDVCLQSVRLPKMPDEELRQTALWEASQRFGLDRNAMQVDFIRTGAMLQSGESREEVILIACSHAAIYARVEPILAAGLRPVAVEAGFSALVRTFSRQARREADRANVRAVVEVGESGSTVLILRGDQVAFCKPIAIGGRHFNLAVSDHLQMEPRQAEELRCARIAAAAALHAANGAAKDSTTDPATDRAVYEAVRPLMGDLVKEVTLCLRYYGVTFRGHPPDHIIITGGDGLEPKLGEVMANACKAPVVFDDPSNVLVDAIPAIRTCLNRTPGPASAWAVAMGLSLRSINRKNSKSEPPSQSSANKTPAVAAASRPMSLDRSSAKEAA